MTITKQRQKQRRNVADFVVEFRQSRRQRDVGPAAQRQVPCGHAAAPLSPLARPSSRTCSRADAKLADASRFGVPPKVALEEQPAAPNGSFVGMRPEPARVIWPIDANGDPIKGKPLRIPTHRRKKPAKRKVRGGNVPAWKAAKAFKNAW